MAKLEELQEQVGRLTAILAQAGITPRLPASEHAPDYIEHGSAKHAVFMGLMEVDDVAQAARDGYTVYKSPRTGKNWRLEDEIKATQLVPGVDPTKAILLVLRQKVTSLESGKPTAPPNAPEMALGEVWR